MKAVPSVRRKGGGGRACPFAIQARPLKRPVRPLTFNQSID
jgi:hypothetical protein